MWGLKRRPRLSFLPDEPQLVLLRQSWSPPFCQARLHDPLSRRSLPSLPPDLIHLLRAALHPLAKTTVIAHADAHKESCGTSRAWHRGALVLQLAQIANEACDATSRLHMPLTRECI